MKKYIKSMENIFGMANLNPKKSGLPVIIWSDHNGVSRKTSHNSPRIKIGNNSYWAVFTIEEDPEMLQHSAHIKRSELNNIYQGVDYVSRNYDLFLKHFNDANYEFDDEALYDALRARGEYK